MAASLCLCFKQYAHTHTPRFDLKTHIWQSAHHLSADSHQHNACHRPDTRHWHNDGQQGSSVLTGASGLVIEQSIADELALSSFGEMHVAGMGGRLLCQFRRARELTLGPLTVQRPLFMQMSLSGVVAGAPGPVAGILG